MLKMFVFVHMSTLPRDYSCRFLNIVDLHISVRFTFTPSLLFYAYVVFHMPHGDITKAKMRTYSKQMEAFLSNANCSLSLIHLQVQCKTHKGRQTVENLNNKAVIAQNSNVKS